MYSTILSLMAALLSALLVLDAGGFNSLQSFAIGFIMIIGAMIIGEALDKLFKQ